MERSEGSSSDNPTPVDFKYVGDWTSWSSLLVLMLLVPLTALCLAPFAAVTSAILPGSFIVWTVIYFAALPVVLIPGLEFLQIWLICPGSRRPTPDEEARLMPLWNNVLSRVGKGKKRRYRLRITDDYRVNAAAGGGSLVIVTTRALTGLPDGQLEAVLAHELGHHVGFHPIMLLAQQWIARPLNWAAKLSVVLHNVLAWLTRWNFNLFVQVILWVAILIIRAALLALKVITQAAWFLLFYLGRQAEHKADTVATKLGYGHELVNALVEIERQEGDSVAAGHQPRIPASSFWNTHPPTSVRIAKIRKAMADDSGPQDPDIM